MTEVRAAAGEALRAAARTDPGCVRPNNEDLPLIDAARGIFGVIDGLGGQAGGEVAAATARDVILQRLARPLGTPAERVREAIAIANNEINRRAGESDELHGMACVVTLALVADGAVTIGHVGDSRMYKIRPEGLRKLTRDHSPVGEREDAGELSEADAMRHPRRHEIFRDVGSIYRDKDEHEFVDVLHEPLEPDSAILLCSDGLTDMLPASTLLHTVRQHAGNPEGVVDALVASANAAGGRDNVTVVYAEMPQFAARMGNGSAVASTEPLPGSSTVQPHPDAPVQPDSGERTGAFGRFWRAVFGSRTTWFALGTLVGVVGALGLAVWWDRTQTPEPQVLVVGTGPTLPFATIASAMADARPGDTIRVEPGLYREFVHVRDGINLVARVPGTVTIARPVGSRAATPGLLITGEGPTRVSGIRFDAAPDLPADLGVRLMASATLELVEVSGAARQAIAVSPGASLTLSGSRIAVIGGVLSVPEHGQATLLNNVVSRISSGWGAAPAVSYAISATPESALTLQGNVFMGYGVEIIGGVSEPRRKELLEGNTVVAPTRNR